MARILLVDDDEGFLEMFVEMLRQSGYEVTTASNGNFALESYRKNPADLVVTDIIMPDKEGIELISELLEEFPDAKIIVVSGGGGIGPKDYLETALMFGAKRAFSKPFRMVEMIAAVEELLAEND
jgi:DNA-binding response OmpR family regulator